MELQKLLSADYLDIIYDQRNKTYGGYELRKHYSRRMAKACAFLLLGVTALASFSFIPSTVEVEPPRVITPYELTEVYLDKPKEQPKLKVETPPPPPPAPVKTRTFTVPKLTDDPIPDDKAMTQNKDLKDAVAGNTDNEIDSGDVLGPSIVSKPGTGTVLPVETKRAEPFVFVEQMPEYPGDINHFISSRISYPEQARNLGIQGRVYIKFVVNEDGSVADATVARGIGGGCDEEALRIVKSMPKWKPGRQNGKAVRVFFTLPLSFVLN